MRRRRGGRSGPGKQEPEKKREQALCFFARLFRCFLLFSSMQESAFKSSKTKKKGKAREEPESGGGGKRKSNASAAVFFFRSLARGAPLASPPSLSPSVSLSRYLLRLVL